MTIYNLYIFDEKGALLYYKEWLRKKHTSMDKPEEGKLLYGMLFSMKSFVGKLSPTDMKDGFTCYRTSKYRLNYFETATGYKFVLNTDTAVTHPIVRDLLQGIYAKVFVEHVIKNPMYEIGQPIECELFETRLDECVKSANFFQIVFMEFTTNSDSVSFAPEIQAMLHAHGDSSRPRLDTAIVLQSVVRGQMRETLLAAANVARMRVSNQIQLEDLLFTLRKDPIRVQRLVKYLSVKDTASANSAKQGLEVTTPANRVRRSREFLYSIDPEGGLLRKAADDELQDASRLERIKMLDRVARHMDVRQYTEFTRGRQVAFINHKHRFSQKFYVWLTTDSTGRAILADDLVDMSIDQSGLEVFTYLANELIALIVDIALIVQQDESHGTDPVQRLVSPYTYSPLVTTKPDPEPVAGDAQVNTLPLEPHHVREAMSRLLLQPRPGEWFTRTSHGFSSIAPRLF